MGEPGKYWILAGPCTNIDQRFGKIKPPIFVFLDLVNDIGFPTRPVLLMNIHIKIHFLYLLIRHEKRASIKYYAIYGARC